MPSSPHLTTSLIYSEAQSPSYISSSSSPHHSRTHHDDTLGDEFDDGEEGEDGDSLANASDAEVERRVNDFFARSPSPSPTPRPTSSGDHTGEVPTTELERKFSRALDPLFDLPRPAATSPAIELELAKGALAFLRQRVAELDETDWQYSMRDGFRGNIGGTDHAEGGEANWSERAFNLEAYPVVDDFAVEGASRHLPQPSRVDEGMNEEDEDTETGGRMRFNDSIEEEEAEEEDDIALEVDTSRFSDGRGQAISNGRRELVKGVEDMVMH